MNVQKYPVAPEAAAERMVLGRMVLKFEDYGMAVTEGMATYGAVSGEGAHPPATPDENPFQSGDGANGFYLSKSRLNRYIACPRSYQLHYDLRIVPLRRTGISSSAAPPTGLLPPIISPGRRMSLSMRRACSMVSGLSTRRK